MEPARPNDAATPHPEAAEAHLERFLAWLALAGGAFGLVELVFAAIFGSWQLAVIGLATIAVCPLAILGRSGLERGRRSAGIASACAAMLGAASVAAILIPTLQIVPAVAILVVLIAMPLVGARTLTTVFAGALVWAVVTSSINLGVARPASVPDWFVRGLNVGALAAGTALTLFLLRSFHTRMLDLLAAARRAEGQYRTLVEQLPAITFVDEVVPADPFEIRPIYVSPQIESLLGYPAERWLNDPELWRSILHPEDRDRAIWLSERVYESRGPYAIEYRVLAADGRLVWIQEASVIVQEAEGQPAIWQGVMFDVTARRAAEEERNRSVELLRRADAQRRELLADLVSAQEAERKRLATEIHDDPVQKMTAVGLRLGFLLRKLSDPEQIGVVKQLQEIVETSIARLRVLMFELRPPALDRGGLVAAVRDLLAELDGSFPRCRVDDDLTDEPPEKIRTVAYRIVAEALANVQRHSHASDVQVLLTERDGGLLVRVRDDGVGIPAETLEGGRPGHLGLTSMRERAEAAGGWSRIDSGPAGTTVEAWLPLADVGAVRSA